jgi:hypothetical protein
MISDKSLDSSPDRVTEKLTKLKWSFWLYGIDIDEFLVAMNNLKV